MTDNKKYNLFELEQDKYDSLSKAIQTENPDIDESTVDQLTRGHIRKEFMRVATFACYRNIFMLHVLGTASASIAAVEAVGIAGAFGSIPPILGGLATIGVGLGAVATMVKAVSAAEVNFVTNRQYNDDGDLLADASGSKKVYEIAERAINNHITKKLGDTPAP